MGDSIWSAIGDGEQGVISLIPDIDGTSSGALLELDAHSRLWKFATWRFICRGLTVQCSYHKGLAQRLLTSPYNKRLQPFIPYFTLRGLSTKNNFYFWQCSLWVSRPENASFLEDLFMEISGSFCPSIGFPSFASALDIACQEPIKLQLTKQLILKHKQKGGFPTASQYTGLLANKTQWSFFGHILHR